jgi:hypothetical protein
MKKIYLYFTLVVVLVFAAITYAFWFLPFLKGGPASQVCDVASQTERNSQASFTPLYEPAVPPFLKNYYPTADIKIDFHYDGVFMPQNTFTGEVPAFYTPPGGSEQFLSLPKTKDRTGFAYGSNTGLEIFKSEESHSYQGTPVYLTNPNNKNYSLSYLGFKINDPTLISSLSVEMGIDYLADRIGKAPGKNNLSLASLLGISTADACGPGVYLRNVGDSNLNLIQTSDGISWYKLEKPIPLYNLDLNYCDNPPGQIPIYCHGWADDPPDCNSWCGDYNTSITDLSKGNLRMHVYYTPNDKEGLLRLQMVNFIASDSQGINWQAEMGQDFNQYYKAYLH